MDVEIPQTSETRTGLSQTADLYARLLRQAGPLGVAERDVAKATELNLQCWLISKAKLNDNRS